MNRWVLFGLGMFIGLAAILGVLTMQPYRFHGAEIEPVRTAPDIELPDTHGQVFQLSQQKGHLVLIFFGYTNCPDVCPATLSEMRGLVENLGERSQDVRVVFVTVDPDRDTPEKMKAYVNAFNPDFIGLSAPLDQLEPVFAAYGVYREIQDVGSASGYLVAHSARTYVIDKHGNLRMTFSFGTPLADIEADVKHLLKEQAE